jgi:REP element-mobilizing transposase RayT
MPRQARQTSATGIYHVVLRGINKQTIFEDAEDSAKFLETLRAYKDACEYQIYAYCLMSNHIHLLIEEGKEPLGSVFKRILGKFVYWYNNKYRRVGHLFQDRYRSEPVETEPYLLAVLRYIHQNPVKAGITTGCEYPLSSYAAYLGEGAGDVVYSAFMSDLMSRDEFVRFHEEVEAAPCIDISERRYFPSDAEASELIRSASGLQAAIDVQKLDTDEKRAVISALRELGLSVRQLSRVTGISKTFIEKIKSGA